MVNYRRKTPAKPICTSCNGSGWTCTECGENGTVCDCHDSTNSVDCQECEGTGTDDEVVMPFDTIEEARGEK